MPERLQPITKGGCPQQASSPLELHRKRHDSGSSIQRTESGTDTLRLRRSRPLNAPIIPSNARMGRQITLPDPAFYPREPLVSSSSATESLPPPMPDVSARSEQGHRRSSSGSELLFAEEKMRWEQGSSSIEDCPAIIMDKSTARNRTSTFDGRSAGDIHQKIAELAAQLSPQTSPNPSPVSPRRRLAAPVPERAQFLSPDRSPLPQRHVSGSASASPSPKSPRRGDSSDSSQSDRYSPRHSPVNVRIDRSVGSQSTSPPAQTLNMGERLCYGPPAVSPRQPLRAIGLHSNSSQVSLDVGEESYSSVSPRPPRRPLGIHHQAGPSQSTSPPGLDRAYAGVLAVSPRQPCRPLGIYQTGAPPLVGGPPSKPAPPPPSYRRRPPRGQEKAGIDGGEAAQCVESSY